MTVMDNVMEKFIDYAEFNEIGDLIGIDQAAPEVAKNAYAEYTEMINSASDNGFKI